jgi:hypothetical protein
MREMRILDRMAIIGTVLAILAIGAPVVWTIQSIGKSEDPFGRGQRAKALDCMPTPDMRADLDIMGLWNVKISDAKRLTMLRTARACSSASAWPPREQRERTPFKQQRGSIHRTPCRCTCSRPRLPSGSPGMRQSLSCAERTACRGLTGMRSRMRHAKETASLR